METIHKAFRFTLEPTKAQAETLSSWAPALRFIWNWMLAQRRDAYRASEGRVSIRYAEQCAQLPGLKVFYPWLAAVPSQVLQQTLKDLDAAFQRFFAGHAKCPVFKAKKKGNVPGLRWPQGVAINGRAVWLPKLGWLKTRMSRRVEGTIKSATVRWDGLRWQISLLCQTELSEVCEAPLQPIGIDLGVQVSLACSEGRLLQLPIASDKESRRCRVLSRRVSRCIPGSKRHAKAKRRLLVFRRKLSNRILDTRQKFTTELAKNHGLIVVEDLALSQMTRSARGTAEAPGKNVAARSGLNRVLLEQGHAETVRQLLYKASWRGGEVRRVDPAYTSQMCPCCGHVGAENRPSRAGFRCMHCDHSGHADVIAAQNILAAGLAASARGGAPSSVETGTTSKASRLLRKRAA